MNKSTNFSGQPIIKQVIKFISKANILKIARKMQSDRYTKKFTTYDHLISMVYAGLSGINSLRELNSVLLGCEGRINHLNISSFPKRSTLSDANMRRSSEVFGEIYYSLLSDYGKFISDSTLPKSQIHNLKIIDSTTISLFKDILKGVGRNPLTGKKKGGIKMHTMINASEDVPCLVRFSSASQHDQTFLKSLELKKGSFVVFDKGYNDYEQYAQWTLDDIHFVTRQKNNAKYTSIEEFDIDTQSPAILKDELIELQKNKQTITLRRIAFWDEKKKRVFEFITNNQKLTSEQVTDIYKQRWQIETMFKRLKQNFPLKYFLGDSQNAIEIQIWVGLIIQLIMLVIQKSAKKKWSFSNMVSVIRYHLMTYIDLFKFLAKPNSNYFEITTRKYDQLSLFG
jgi:hypothetical protein